MKVTIRRAVMSDADALAAVHDAAWEASYRGIVPDEDFEKRPLTRRQQQWRDWLSHEDRVTIAACDEHGAILGFAGGRLLAPHEHGFDSYLSTLYVHPYVKGRGIGKRVLAAFAAEMRRIGKARSLVLRTLRLGEARGFYEHLGARLVPEGIGIDAGIFDDVVYAFDDINTLD